MRRFITVLVFCSSVLEFSSSRQNRGIWSPLFEKMRMLDGKSSEYIDTELLNDDLAKHDPSLSTINSSKMKTSRIGSLKKRSVSTESFYNLLATEKRSKHFSISHPGPKNYGQKFQKHDSSGDKIKPIVETVNWNFSLKPFKKVNKEIRKSEKFYWISMRTDSNKLTENRRGSEKSNDYRKQTFIRTLTEQGETDILQSNIPLEYKPNYSNEFIAEISKENTKMSTNTVRSSKKSVNSVSTEQSETNILQNNIPLQYKPNYSAEVIGEISKENTEMSTNTAQSSKEFRFSTERGETNILQNNIPLQYKPNYSAEFIEEISKENTEMPTNTARSSKKSVNSFSHATTTSIVNHFKELPMFNRSSLESSSHETSNSSVSVHLPPSPHSRLSKTAVAAIVAVINGIIGFTGAAIFTCTKHNYSLNGERRPLIR